MTGSAWMVMSSAKLTDRSNSGIHKTVDPIDSGKSFDDVTSHCEPSSLKTAEQHT
jgi:hypothetical protein